MGKGIDTARAGGAGIHATQRTAEIERLERAELARLKAKYETL